MSKHDCQRLIIGLKTATQGDIDELKKTYSRGGHKLYCIGRKIRLPFNGVFHTCRIKGEIYERT